MIDKNSVHYPILICAKTVEDNHQRVFHGDNCSAELLDFLNEHTINQFSEDRKVICVFHNFKGYDGMFIQEELTKQKCVIDNIITNWTKVKSMSVGDITFKDLLCFLPMALASFPATFGLTELKKRILLSFV